MRAFVLQDWVTIRGATAIQSVVQNEANYLAMDPYQDAIFWLQVSEVTTGGGTITMAYETAPLKDETLFTPMQALSISATQMTPPKISQCTLSLAGTNNVPPLSRWVRWHITTSGSGSWDMAFRILVSGNQLWAPPAPQGQGMGMGGGIWPGFNKPLGT